MRARIERGLACHAAQLHLRLLTAAGLGQPQGQAAAGTKVPRIEVERGAKLGLQLIAVAALAPHLSQQIVCLGRGSLGDHSPHHLFRPLVVASGVDELSKVQGLELGADDYVTKPFGHLELLARVRAVLRRAEALPLTHERPFVSGDIQVDFTRHEVTVRGQPVALTSTEFRLLYYLVRNAGQILTHETLLARVWGRDYTNEISYLKSYINRLRSKLERDPHHPEYILTEHTVGYWFRPE